MAHAPLVEQNGESDTYFLFSPSASYPQPFACLIDRRGRVAHAWSSSIDQPTPESEPPTYLRGWNHVELGPDGSLYAMVPLHALLKLRPDSSLEWRAELPVHHDLTLHPSGDIYVLTEEPRTVPGPGGGRVLLDNTITILSSSGEIRATHSLYDLLTTHPVMKALIDKEADRRAAEAGPTDPAAYSPDGRRGREVSRLLRDLPGSPCDVLHANTVEILRTHPKYLWGEGDVLISLRNLDLIAVLDLAARAVRWFWGPGELSGQHQPSARPGGTVLVFDNGQAHGRSRILEIDPSTDQVVWQYTANPPHSLFSAMAGGCEELPGGTILVSDAQGGRGIELTREGRTIWAVRISTVKSLTARTSRAEFYRMAPVPAATAALLGDVDGTARDLAASRVRCELREDLPLTLRSSL
ncbi:arylsulfotransferase family protein [Streptomyces graminilatus]|uniref:arylsulfotransferase family protein n=1 Tax=Streptomyces graminilatus TaxID=1464070 RepID=UPI0006E2C083|nr:arylsulfotransferase family protein [Streptomyces graminilatus]